QLLSNHDNTISDEFTRVAKEAWQVALNRTLHSIDRHDGRLRVNLSATGHDQDEVVDYFIGDVVLLATGRKPNTDRLNLDAAGIDVENGFIARDEYLRVLSDGKPLDGVWAMGDIANPQMLKHVANHEQR